MLRDVHHEIHVMLDQQDGDALRVDKPADQGLRTRTASWFKPPAGSAEHD